MTSVNNDRPHSLMPTLLEIRDSGKCPMLEFSCIVDELKTTGHEEVAAWLESHEASYKEIITQEFPQWLKEHFPDEPDSIAQDAAAATGLEMPEDSFS
ncbi:hypothetical protein [Gloeocapsopsis dulcis]|uniref:Uncharacterized protein n=1 Tax=Gloeocapsopsis dulcis AAB1 = 1H9 TaxID=1433147 RepID=A0A6N8FV73_9CHRO|nr:hypothetical protein [Gloeocapsopsis dulcis]MUL36057.1 hypothetical protein [Gloeocapsopsis dulcis AAB1 = 1H9]WNN91474.1 hypothetical protein P0S91_10540 [Gloeocapsopsis dulcis]